MLKSLFIFFYILSFFPFSVRAESQSTVVINSYQVAGQFATDEFIEVKNISESPQSLNCFRLVKLTASGSESILVSNFPDLYLQPKDALIVAHNDYFGYKDLSYSNKSYSLAGDNSIALYGAPDIQTKKRSLLDLVGFGEAKMFEGSPVNNPEKEEVYTRKNEGQDTNNNKNDFFLSYSPPKQEPNKEESGVAPQKGFPEATVGAKIKISEFLPNPEGRDAEGEWIEIYNEGAAANISGYIIADRLGSPKKYTIPTGTKINKNQYLAFYSGKTPISLNNDSDAVEVRSPEGTVISYSAESGKGPEGASFAYIDGKWAWTSRPTPGEKNILGAIEKKDEQDTENKNLSLVENDFGGDFSGDQEVKGATELANRHLLGYGLITLAIIGAISYTFIVNKEKIRECYYNKIRRRDYLSRSKIWRRLKRRRDISSDG